VFVPARVPAAVTDAIHRGFIRALNSPEVKERLVGNGYDLLGTSPAEFRRYVLDETAKWAKVVKMAGIKAE